MTVTEDRAADKTAGPWCSQHRRPRSECLPPWDRHSQPLRCSDELMRRVEAKARVLGLDRNGGVEAALQAWTDGPEKASAGARLPSIGSDREKPAEARTEPPAPAPAARREAGRKGSEEPPVAAADLPDRDRQIAELRSMIEALKARMDNGRPPSVPRQRPPVTVIPDVTPGTPIFLTDEPGATPVIPYQSPEVPERAKKARSKCPHRIPAGSWCKTCGTAK